MKLSVAMCTYNGAKYITQQLDSMLDQTLPLDEIVICDDGSTDGTHSIICDYQERYPGVIHLYINQQKLGFCANFDKAIHLCKGDIIFLADQDDVWHKDKTQTIKQYFDTHKKKNVVFTNTNLITGDGVKRSTPPQTLFEVLGFNWVAKLWFNIGFDIDVQMVTWRCLGATMALRKEFVPDILIDHNTGVNNPNHDGNIAIQATENHSLGYIQKSLIDYRLHEGQTVGLNLEFRASNNIFTVYNLNYVQNVRTFSKPGGRVFRRTSFFEYRIIKKEKPSAFILKLHLYIYFYHIFGPFVWMYDVLKAIKRTIMKH